MAMRSDIKLVTWLDMGKGRMGGRVTVVLVEVAFYE